MNQIFDDAKDVHVRATLIYAKTGDAFAYSDSAKTAKINFATMTELFHKGVIIVDGSNEYRPVSMLKGAAGGVLTYAKNNETTASTAVLTTLASSDYVAIGV